MAFIIGDEETTVTDWWKYKWIQVCLNFEIFKNFMIFLSADAISSFLTSAAFLVFLSYVIKKLLQYSKMFYYLSHFLYHVYCNIFILHFWKHHMHDVNVELLHVTLFKYCTTVWCCTISCCTISMLHHLEKKEKIEKKPFFPEMRVAKKSSTGWPRIFFFF